MVSIILRPETRTTLLGGFEPPIYRLTAGRLNHWANRAYASSRVRTCALHRETGLKPVALDHSAMDAFNSFLSCLGLSRTGFEPISPD